MSENSNVTASLNYYTSGNDAGASIFSWLSSCRSEQHSRGYGCGNDWVEMVTAKVNTSTTTNENATMNASMSDAGIDSLRGVANVSVSAVALPRNSAQYHAGHTLHPSNTQCDFPVEMFEVSMVAGDRILGLL